MTELPSMSVIVPTRGRPESMKRLSDAFKETCGDSTVLHWVVDADDASLEAYEHEFRNSDYQFQAFWIVPKGPKGIVHPLNWVTKEVFQARHGFYPTVVGFLGDDFIPRTQDWDKKIQVRLAEAGTGVAYANDLLQGPNLCTAWFVTSDIAQVLGLAPPALNHLWVDNYWMDLARGAGCLHYLSGVILEHMHPLNNKSEWDDTYERNNNSAASMLDRLAYQEFVRSGKLNTDIAIVKALKEVE